MNSVPANVTRVAVGLGRVVGRDREIGGRDEQQAVDVGDRVVAEAGADGRGRRDRVRAAGHGGRRRRARADDRDAVDEVAVEQADGDELRPVEDRRRAVDLGRVDGRDRERGRVDGQLAVDVGDRVVAEAGADGGRRDDRVRAAGDRGRRRGTGARERDRCHRVAVQEAAGRELRPGEGHRVAVGLGRVIGGDGQRGRVHGEHAADVADRVVGEAGADRRRRRDRVRAAGDGRRRGRARARERDAGDGVRVLEAGGRELGARERDRLAVGLGAVVGRDRQGGGVHREARR